MADELKKPNYILWGALAAAAYLVYKNSTSTTTDASSAWGSGPTTGAATSTTPIVATPTPTGTTVATSSAPASAPVSAAAAAPLTPGDGAPHRKAGPQVDVSTGFSAADVASIRAISLAWQVPVEDVVDVVSFQERQDRKGWSQIASEYAANPSWFRDKAVEYNATNPTYRIGIS